MFAQCLNKGSRKLYRVGTNKNQFVMRIRLDFISYLLLASPLVVGFGGYYITSYLLG